MGGIRSFKRLFSDPLIDCRECKTRHRADKLIDEYDIRNWGCYDSRRDDELY